MITEIVNHVASRSSTYYHEAKERVTDLYHKFQISLALKKKTISERGTFQIMTAGKYLYKEREKQFSALKHRRQGSLSKGATTTTITTKTTVDQRYLAAAFWEWQQQMPFVPTLSESFVHMQNRTRLNQNPRMQCRRSRVRMGRLVRGKLSEGQLFQWSRYQDRIPMELIV